MTRDERTVRARRLASLKEVGLAAQHVRGVEEILGIQEGPGNALPEGLSVTRSRQAERYRREERGEESNLKRKPQLELLGRFRIQRSQGRGRRPLFLTGARGAVWLVRVSGSAFRALTLLMVRGGLLASATATLVGRCVFILVSEERGHALDRAAAEPGACRSRSHQVQG